MTDSLTSYEKEALERHREFLKNPPIFIEKDANGNIPNGCISCACVCAIVKEKECNCAW